MVDLTDGTWTACPMNVIMHDTAKLIQWYVHSDAENMTIEVTEVADSKDKTLRYSWTIGDAELDERYHQATEDGFKELADMYNKEIELHANASNKIFRDLSDIIIKARKEHNCYKEIEDYKVVN